MRLLSLVLFAGVSLSGVSAQRSLSTSPLDSPLDLSDPSSCQAPECVAKPDQTLYQNVHSMLEFSLAAHHLHISPLSSFAPLLNDTDTETTLTAFPPINDAVMNCREGVIRVFKCESSDEMEDRYRDDCSTLLRMRELDNTVMEAVGRVRSGELKPPMFNGLYNMFVDPSEYEKLKFSPIMKDYIRGVMSHLLVPTSILSSDLEVNVTNVFPTLFNTTDKGMLALTSIKNKTGHFDLVVARAADGFADTLYLPFARMSSDRNWTATVMLKDIQSSNGILHGIDTIIPLPFTLKSALKYNKYRGFLALLNYTGLTNLTSAAQQLTVFVPNDDAFRSLLPTLSQSSEFAPLLSSALNNNEEVDADKLFKEQVDKIGKVYKAFKRPLKIASKMYDRIQKELQYRIDTANSMEKADMTRLVGNHLFPSMMYSTNFTDGMDITSMSGTHFTIHMNPPNAKVWKAEAKVGNATVRWADLIIKNGVIHELDGVLAKGPSKMRGEGKPLRIEATIRINPMSMSQQP